MARTVILPDVPSLAGLYARGAVSSGRLALARRTGRAAATLPDVTYTVQDVQADPERLTAYQHLLGEPASDELPAGFVHVLAFPVATALMTRSDFPLPLAGLVHVANRVEQRRPLRLGEPLDVHAHATALRAHRSGTQVDLVTEVCVTGFPGEPAWRGVSTYLAKGVWTGAGTADDGPRARFDPPLPTGRWDLRADTGRRYATVSGDRNPIHLSALSARAFGFRRAIAHGMYTAARLLAIVGARRGPAFVWSVDFAAPVLLPGTVAVRVAPRGDGWTLAAWEPRGGKPHLTGSVGTL